VLAGGKFRSKSQDQEHEKAEQSGQGRQAFPGAPRRAENEITISKPLEKVAEENGIKSIQAGKPITDWLR